MTRYFTRWAPPPWVPIAIAGTVIVVAWGIFLVVDVYNLGGTRNAVARSGLEHPYLWTHIFRDGGPVEITTWSMLGWVSVMAGIAGGILAVWAEATGDPEGTLAPAGRFWRLIAVAGVILLLEDAGEIRHYLNRYVSLFGGGATPTYFELTYCAGLASVPLYAFVRYGRSVVRVAPVRRYGTAGVVLYALAAIGSGAHAFGEPNLYTRIGRFVSEDLLGGHLLLHQDWSRDQQWMYVTDLVVEEPIELMAATFLVAAVLAYARDAPLGPPEEPARSTGSAAPPEADRDEAAADARGGR